MNWCFARINNKIGEIYFDRNKTGSAKIWGHCFVKKSEFELSEEKIELNEDIKKFKVIYKNNQYTFVK